MKGILGRSLSRVDTDQEREKWSFWSHANPATPVCFLCLLVQLSRPGAPEGGVHTWGWVEVVCVLVIFSHLTLYSSTDSGWTSGKGGWVCTSGSQADGQQGGDKGDSDWRDNPLLCPQWDELGFVAPFCICCTQSEVERSEEFGRGGKALS